MKAGPRRFRMCLALTIFGVGSVAACGTSGSTGGGSTGDGSLPGQACPSREVYCGGCGGGGFCAQACPLLECPSDAGGIGGEAGGADGGACPATAPSHCTDCNGGGFCVSGTCPVASCPGADASSDAPVAFDAAESGPVDAAPPGLIRCGSAWCNATNETCCLHPDFTGYCAAKGTCNGLACSSPASCLLGQVCCAAQSSSGTVTSQCAASGPCPLGSGPSSAYLLCATPGDCPSGQPCSYNLIPAVSGGPLACDKCAGVSCASPKQCCPGTGQCYNPGCGSCCG